MKKNELRRYFKNKRKELSELELEMFSNQITTHLFQHFDLSNKTISIFLPIKRHNEINTFPILEQCIDKGTKVALPVSDFETNELSHYLFVKETTELTENAYGIIEPRNGLLVNPAEIDVVFVPLLGVDKSGYRVGYGKGFYDRFLLRCSKHCLFIGLHLFEIAEKIIDCHENDVPLHGVICPEGYHSFPIK